MKTTLLIIKRQTKAKSNEFLLDNCETLNHINVFPFHFIFSEI